MNKQMSKKLRLSFLEADKSNLDFENYLREKWGIKFHDSKHLLHALRHPSFCKSDFETYEFLGDKVIGLIASNELFITQLASEGDFSRKYACWVNKYALANIGKKLGLEKAICTRGDVKQDTLLSDGFEALMAAIYIDQGLECATTFWRRIATQAIPISNKTNLQEWAHVHGATPSYESKKIGGTEHSPVFETTVTIKGIKITSTGNSKKEAENNAAEKFVKKYNITRISKN